MKERAPDASNEYGTLNYAEALDLQKEILSETRDSRLKISPEGFFEIGGKIIEWNRMVKTEEGDEIPLKGFIMSHLNALPNEEEVA